jgi:hypothetical protein
MTLGSRLVSPGIAGCDGLERRCLPIASSLCMVPGTPTKQSTLLTKPFYGGDEDIPKRTKDTMAAKPGWRLP